MKYMMFPIGKVENLKDLNELVPPQNQVQKVRLQYNLSKQNFHENMKKVFEPVTKSLEKTSEKLTKAIPESSNINNKALENLNN